MGLKGNNFSHHVFIGLALAPQSVTNTTASGVAIEEPWKKARQLAFIALGGAFAATVNGILKVQGRLRSDGATWEDIQTPTGDDLEFLQTLLDDGGGLENGAALGTIDLSSISGDTYEAIRIHFTEGGNAAALIGVAYVLYDLYKHPSGQVDYLKDEQRYGS